MQRLAMLWLVISSCVTPCFAEDGSRALEAYNAGQYEIAYEEWLRQATDGSAAAQYSLGTMYNDGIGVSQDYSEAARWFELAASQGMVEAQHQLGTLYLYGQGVEKDRFRSREYYMMAALNGFGPSQFLVAVDLATVGWVSRDFRVAYMWFRISEMNGMSQAKEQIEFFKPMMSKEHLKDAQSMASRCINSAYSQCQ